MPDVYIESQNRMGEVMKKDQKLGTESGAVKSWLRHALTLGGRIFKPKAAMEIYRTELGSEYPILVERNRSYTDVEMLQLVGDFYEDNFFDNVQAVHGLLERRCFAVEAIKEFRLGYSDGTLRYRIPETLPNSGELHEQLVRLGIYTEGGREVLNGCLVVPFLDSEGNIVGFGGQRLTSSRRAQRDVVFPKAAATVVWNGAALERAHSWIICGSPLEVLALWCNGFQNVTLMGGDQGFGPAHLDLLDRAKPEKVFICLSQTDFFQEEAEVIAGKIIDAGGDVWKTMLDDRREVTELVRVSRDPKVELTQMFGRATRWKRSSSAENARGESAGSLGSGAHRISPGDERSKALELLSKPNFFEAIIRDFHRCGVVGEERNLALAWLGTLSRKLSRPLPIAVASTSCDRSSSFLEAVVAFVPDEDVYQHVALQLEEFFNARQVHLQNKVVLVEDCADKREGYSIKAIKQNGEVVVASTTEETGGRISARTRVKYVPMALMIATSCDELDSAVRRPMVVLELDESPEHLEALGEARRREQSLQGVIERRARPRIRSFQQNVQRLIRPLAVENPFFEKLQADPRFKDPQLFQKYLDLLNAIALVHQYQRPLNQFHQETAGPVEYVEVIAEDLVLADSLLGNIGRSEHEGGSRETPFAWLSRSALAVV